MLYIIYSFCGISLPILDADFGECLKQSLVLYHYTINIHYFKYIKIEESGLRVIKSLVVDI